MKENDLLAGMLPAFPTSLHCRRPAFCERAVTKPTVLFAGLEPADHIVGAARNPTFSGTAAMFATENLA